MKNIQKLTLIQKMKKNKDKRLKESFQEINILKKLL